MSKNKLTRNNAKELRGNKPATGDDYAEQKPSAIPPAEPEPAIELKQTEPAALEDVQPLKHAALTLLDRAIQTTIKNKGQNLNDEMAKIRLTSQSELLEAVGGNLPVACMAIMESPTPDDLTGSDRRPNRVFSLLYGVMRSVIFTANGAYRRWLDPRPNFAVADHNETREAPWGLQPEREDEDFEQTLIDAVEQIAAFFGGLAQVCGFSLDGGDAGVSNALNGAFPLAYEMRPDLSLEPITDFHRAVDLIEKKRQASLKRRAETEQKAMSEARTRALELMAKMQVAKPAPAKA